MPIKAAGFTSPADATSKARTVEAKRKAALDGASGVFARKVQDDFVKRLDGGEAAKYGDRYSLSFEVQVEANDEDYSAAFNNVKLCHSNRSDDQVHQIIADAVIGDLSEVLKKAGYEPELSANPVGGRNRATEATLYVSLEWDATPAQVKK